MYLKYSFGFLIASLVQLIIIISSENLGLSNLGARANANQVITHIIIGQIGGYVLLFIYTRLNKLKNYSYWLVGAVYGFVIWAILMPIQSNLGKINAPWIQGASTLLVSIITFLIFGIIADYTIKRYRYTRKVT